jgi:hypothetical protein
VRCLIGEFGTDGLVERARQHQLAGVVARTLRLARALCGSAGPEACHRPTAGGRLFLRRLLARDG